MAIEKYIATQAAEGYRGRPTDDHGKLRIQFFDLPALTVLGDAESTIDLCELPPGAIRILPAASRISVSALGAARVLDIGHRAYRSRPSGEAVSEAENLTALVDNFAAATAQVAVAFAAALKYDVYSIGGVMMAARVQGGTIPIGATISGYFVYIAE